MQSGCARASDRARPACSTGARGWRLPDHSPLQWNGKRTALAQAAVARAVVARRPVGVIYPSPGACPLVPPSHCDGKGAGGLGPIPNLAQHAQRLLAHVVQVYPHLLQDAASDALTLADETQQQMLGADIVVVQVPRLRDG